jgi:hypothetical protein
MPPPPSFPVAPTVRAWLRQEDLRVSTSTEAGFPIPRPILVWVSVQGRSCCLPALAFRLPRPCKAHGVLLIGDWPFLFRGL